MQLIITSTITSGVIILPLQLKNMNSQDAAFELQRWYRRMKKFRNAFKLVQKDIELIQNVMIEFLLNQSFDNAGGILFNDVFAVSISNFLKAISSLSYLKNSTNISTMTRLLSSALMVSKFPEQVLFSEESSNTPEGAEEDPVEKEAMSCLIAARSLSTQLQNVLHVTIVPAAVGAQEEHLHLQRDSTTCSVGARYRRLQAFSFALYAFSRAFEEWRAADALRLIDSLKLSFAQTYSVHLATSRSPTLDTEQKQLIAATERQLDKIRAALVQLLGRQSAASQIEEICAAVEAASVSMAAAESSSTTNTDSTGTSSSTAAAIASASVAAAEEADRENTKGTI